MQGNEIHRLIVRQSRPSPVSVGPKLVTHLLTVMCVADPMTSTSFSVCLRLDRDRFGGDIAKRESVRDC